MRSKIHEYLREDIGSGDITSELLIPPDQKARGRIIAKERCVLAGASEASEVFKELGAKAVMRRSDGASVKKGDFVLSVSGPARSILAGERLALNFLMKMSGIATVTNELLEKCRIKNPNIRIAATRKTTPGFREFEKKAVVLGGGDPHRFGLSDAILIKDNHIMLAGSVKEALRRARKSSFTKKIEIEVENEKDAFTALEAGADIIMLDNFSPSDARALYRVLKDKSPDIIIEASGGIKPDNIALYADAADIISVGWLTHSVRSVDFSMSVEKV
ncbi:MAG: carboxylating nicotinate-nucleotide diphosphorylase [Candidatus Thermoplasmatota archaeon]|nr:carboxylating nicotinate-nucleotide diphosphorylase [Candidatus Thermoplasmatota archaeon]